MTGLGYWRQVLAPYARGGYRTGFVDDLEVTLVNEVDGSEVHLARPSAAWHLPLLPSLDGTEDGDPEATRGIRYLMKVGSDRMELTV